MPRVSSPIADVPGRQLAQRRHLRRRRGDVLAPDRLARALHDPLRGDALRRVDLAPERVRFLSPRRVAGDRRRGGEVAARFRVACPAAATARDASIARRKPASHAGSALAGGGRTGGGVTAAPVLFDGVGVIGLFGVAMVVVGGGCCRRRRRVGGLGGGFGRTFDASRVCSSRARCRLDVARA